MPTEKKSRQQGVEFGSLADELEREGYPMSREELVETYGTREIGLPNGDEPLSDVLEPLGETTFDSAEDVIQRVIGTVGEGAIGRKGYTDRGGMSNEDDRSEESM